LFSKLKRAGLLQSVRGPGGGYELARPLGEVTVSDIIAAVGEGVDATRCHGAADCHDGAMCLTHDLWTALSNHIDEFLSERPSTQLVAQREPRPRRATPGSSADRRLL
jgi:Rrf2 family transcriptional regulator, iron-sulfur cluster assembly transcription factor